MENIDCLALNEREVRGYLTVFLFWHNIIYGLIMHWAQEILTTISLTLQEKAIARLTNYQYLLP